MESQKTNQPQKFKKKEMRYSSIYSSSLITRSISIPVVNVSKNLKQTIENVIAHNFEGKCVAEGYIKPASCKIITYSSGVVKASNVIFEVVFECLVCCPVEGMLLQCQALNITKAGIRAESSDEKPSPVVVFVMRDHQYASVQFSEIKEGDKFVARIIGQRFELNDKYVSIIAELVEKKEFENVGEKKKFKPKPKLIIKED
jgi:DNA-directed RNA polymerase subunit E'/Rpb7